MKYTKAPLTVAQHLELASRLIAARNTVMETVDRFPKTSRQGRAVRQCLKNLDTIRSALDGDLCALTARSDPRNIATAVYYGQSLVPDPATINATNDAFAGWKHPAR